MLAFAAPGALIALAVLAVPIALHLWSRRTGRPLRIGSIALFAAAPPPATRSPRIEDLWLLLLRCAVLAALAFALAGPHWRTGGRPVGTTWALVAPGVAADSAARPLLDSLRSSGAELHTLGAGPIWSLLREADYSAPPGTRFVVVAPDRGAIGARPTLRSEVQWIVEAGRQGNDVEERRTLPRHVLVYSDATRREDARYVTAALRAAAQASRQAAVLTQLDAGASLNSAADWIVWLAARPVPEPLLERVPRGATLLTDALADEPRDAAARLRLAAATDPDGAPVLRRRTAAAAGSSAPVWTDDAGQPVLTLQREGAGRWLRFHARFHPSWSDLVLQPAFAEAMTALWAGDAVRAPDPLAQRVAGSQLLPGRDPTPTGAATRRDLYHAFWLAGLLLFLVERLLARRSRTVTA